MSAIRQSWPNWAIAIGSLCALATFGASPILSKWSILIVGVGATARCARFFNWRWIPLAGIALTFVAIEVWGRYDWSTYERRWSKDDCQYIDTYRHRDSQHVHRRLFVYDSAAAREKRETERYWGGGPIAGTGKPHGEWKWVYRKPKYESITEFYWYGDRVSEGEWHLRNK